MAFTVKVGDAKLEDVGRIGQELGQETEAQFGTRSSTTRTGPIPNGLRPDPPGLAIHKAWNPKGLDADAFEFFNNELGNGGGLTQQTLPFAK